MRSNRFNVLWLVGLALLMSLMLGIGSIAFATEEAGGADEAAIQAELNAAMKEAIKERENNNRYIAVPGRGDMPYYGQRNPLWNRLRYEQKGSKTRRIFGDGGCSPTALAMAVAALLPREDLVVIKDYAMAEEGFGICTTSMHALDCKTKHGRYWFETPDDYFDYLPLVLGSYAAGNNKDNDKWRLASATVGGRGGTNSGYFYNIVDHYGLDMTVIEDKTDLSWVDALRNNAVVVALANTTAQPFTSGNGHYVTVMAADDEYIYIFDPIEKTKYPDDKHKVIEVIESGYVKVKIEDINKLCFNMLFVMDTKDGSNQFGITGSSAPALDADPALELEPTVEPTIEPTIEPISEPTIEAIIEPTIEPVPELTPEPVIIDNIEPAASPAPEIANAQSNNNINNNANGPAPKPTAGFIEGAEYVAPGTEFVPAWQRDPWEIGPIDDMPINAGKPTLQEGETIPGTYLFDNYEYIDERAKWIDYPVLTADNLPSEEDWTPPDLTDISADAPVELLLVKIAQGELGYKEKPKNINPYSYFLTKKYDAWCSEFVAYCNAQIQIRYGREVWNTVFPIMTLSDHGMRFFKQAGRFVSATETNIQYTMDNPTELMTKRGYIPQIGDHMWFCWETSSHITGHTAIVEGVTIDEKGVIWVHTLEGNNNSTTQRRTQKLNAGHIYGYGTPVRRVQRVLKRKDEGEDVMALKSVLLELGYYEVETEKEREFTSNLEKSLKQYQTDQNIKDSGKLDIDTYNALKKSYYSLYGWE